MRHLDDVGEWGALRVEVEDEPVRALERADPGAPHVERDRAEVRDVAQALAVVHDEVVDVAPGVLRVHALGPDPRGNPLGSVLLEEGLALDAVGVARQHERPVLQVRQHERRDARVVLEEVPLRVPLVRPEHLVQVRELERPVRRPRPLPARVLAMHVLHLLVVPQALVGRRAQPPVARPLQELHLADELRLDPGHVAGAHTRHLRLDGKRRRLSP